MPLFGKTVLTEFAEKMDKRKMLEQLLDNTRQSLINNPSMITSEKVGSLNKVILPLLKGPFWIERPDDLTITVHEYSAYGRRVIAAWCEEQGIAFVKGEPSADGLPLVFDNPTDALLVYMRFARAKPKDRPTLDQIMAAQNMTSRPADIKYSLSMKVKYDEPFTGCDPDED